MHELSIKDLEHYLKPRPKDCHKGDFGKVLIIGGHLGFSGAVRLAGEAALRTGAGSVHIATRPEHATSLNVACPELMCQGILHHDELNHLIDKANFIVIGPGLGTDTWSSSLLQATLAHKDKPLLLDADALNLIAKNKIEMKRSNCIYTPHAGEAAKLLATTAEKIQQQRCDALHSLYKLLKGVIVLKGSKTLILSETNKVEICNAGNPGMASGGMGDILSGIIAGLGAQHIPLHDAAKLGVLIHAMAADLSAAEEGERGMLASDVISHLRKMVNK